MPPARKPRQSNVKKSLNGAGADALRAVLEGRRVTDDLAAVELPEAGITVYVKQLTWADMVAFGAEGDVSSDARAIAYSVTDANGDRIFPDEHMDMIDRLDLSDRLRLVAAVMRTNPAIGMQSDDLGNASEATPSSTRRSSLRKSSGARSAK